MAVPITMEELMRAFGRETLPGSSNMTAGVGAFPSPPSGAVPITMEELMRAFGRPMAPVQNVQQAPVELLSAPQQAQPAQAKPRGLFGFLADPDARARLAIALEGMTLNPNQALIQTQAEGIKSRADEKKAATEINRTAAWLRSQGRDDLAAAVESGALGGRDAAGIAMRPAQSNVPASFQALHLQAQAAGLKPGTPEYQKFMMTGGAADTGVPAAFAALDAQAQAAGFVPGSQEYKDFMATRGAGLAEAAKITAGAAAEAQVAAPGDIAAADKALAEIEGIKKHPGLDRGTGWTSLANSIPGTVGYDFQNRVNQVKSGAFMTAIEQMRGLGALSNAEGQTATAAVNRMDTATSKEEFLAAMSDYEAIIKIGRDRAQKKIKAPETPASPPAANAPSGNTRLKFNAETGAFE